MNRFRQFVSARPKRVQKKKRRRRAPAVRQSARDGARGAYRDAILAAAERVFATSGLLRDAHGGHREGGRGRRRHPLQLLRQQRDHLLGPARDTARGVPAQRCKVPPSRKIPSNGSGRSWTACSRRSVEKGGALAVFMERGAVGEYDVERLIGANAARDYEEFLSLLEETVRDAVRSKRMRGDVEPRLLVSGLAGSINGAIYSWLKRGRRGRVSRRSPTRFSIYFRSGSTLPMTSRSSSLAALVGLSAALLASCHAAEGQGLPPASGSGAPPPPVIPKLAEVAWTRRRQPRASQAAWTGSLFARHEAALGPKMSGVLSQVTVEEGDRVKKGQLLFRLDAAQAGLAVSQAKAAIATAQVGVDATGRDYGRGVGTHREGLHRAGDVRPGEVRQRPGKVVARRRRRSRFKVAERAAVRHGYLLAHRRRRDGEAEERGRDGHHDAADGRGRRSRRGQARTPRELAGKGAHRARGRQRNLTMTIPTVAITPRRAGEAHQPDARHADANGGGRRRRGQQGRQAQGRHAGSSGAARRGTAGDGQGGRPAREALAVSVADVSIKRPVFAVMMIAALVVFGLLAYPRIGVDLFPDVEFPVVTILATYPGADPETMESKVADPIEEAINSLSGIKALRSTNLESVSQVVVEFELNVSADQAVQDIRDRVSGILANLPSGIDPPVIQKFDVGAAPIMAVALAGKLSPRDLTHLADKVVKERIQRVPGVGGIDLVGKRDREIQILLDPTRLAGRGLTVGRRRERRPRADHRAPGRLLRRRRA